MARVKRGTRCIYISVVSVVLSSVQWSESNSFTCLLAILSTLIITWVIHLGRGRCVSAGQPMFTGLFGQAVRNHLHCINAQRR